MNLISYLVKAWHNMMFLLGLFGLWLIAGAVSPDAETKIIYSIVSPDGSQVAVVT
jgi:hypothetical protein